MPVYFSPYYFYLLFSPWWGQWYLPAPDFLDPPRLPPPIIHPPRPPKPIRDPFPSLPPVIPTPSPPSPTPIPTPPSPLLPYPGPPAYPARTRMPVFYPD